MATVSADFVHNPLSSVSLDRLVGRAESFASAVPPAVSPSCTTRTFLSVSIVTSRTFPVYAAVAVVVPLFKRIFLTIAAP
jgi:hypothetical protein